MLTDLVPIYMYLVEGVIHFIVTLERNRREGGNNIGRDRGEEGSSFGISKILRI
jgi:hypothetical protein